MPAVSERVYEDESSFNPFDHFKEKNIFKERKIEYIFMEHQEYGVEKYQHISQMVHFKLCERQREMWRAPKGLVSAPRLWTAPHRRASSAAACYG